MMNLLKENGTDMKGEILGRRDITEKETGTINIQEELMEIKVLNHRLRWTDV